MVIINLENSFHYYWLLKLWDLWFQLICAFNIESIKKKITQNLLVFEWTGEAQWPVIHEELLQINPCLDGCVLSQGNARRVPQGFCYRQAGNRKWLVQEQIAHILWRGAEGELQRQNELEQRECDWPGKAQQSIWVSWPVLGAILHSLGYSGWQIPGIKSFIIKINTQTTYKHKWKIVLPVAM